MKKTQVQKVSPSRPCCFWSSRSSSALEIWGIWCRNSLNAFPKLDVLSVTVAVTLSTVSPYKKCMSYINYRIICVAAQESTTRKRSWYSWHFISITNIVNGHAHVTLTVHSPYGLWTVRVVHTYWAPASSNFKFCCICWKLSSSLLLRVFLHITVTAGLTPVINWRNAGFSTVDRGRISWTI